MILILDNYDSFSYNLYQYVGMLAPDLRVVRNDEMTVREIRNLNPRLIILSPGPGRPSDAGVCEEVVQALGPTVPIFGVCLGHQAICEAYGAEITYARRLMHGKQSIVTTEGDSPLFAGLPRQFPVGRYHSLAADEATMPEDLRVIARTPDGEIMAVQHKRDPVYGVQFHPESILTPCGLEMIKNLIGGIAL